MGEQRSAAETLPIIFGTALTLAAGALLFIASLLFVFTGFCLDDCDGAADWALGSALGNAAPFLVPAIGLLIGGCYLFMAAPAGRTSVWRAILLALRSTLVFAVLFAAFGEAFRISGGFAVFVGVALALVWVIGTSAVAYRAGLRG